MIHGLADVMKQSGSFCQTYIFPNLSSKETGQLCYFDRMFESVLSIACPIFHLAKQTDQFRVLKNEALLKDLSIYTLTALPDGRVFGGTSVVAGTGGQVKAKEARFFELDPATGKILWDGALLPRVQTYHDTMLTPDGKILGIADSERIFVFDPATRKVVATGTTGEYGPAVWQQGPRMFVTDGTNYYLLCRNHILQLNPKDGKILRAFESPVPIQVGGDILNGRLYFASGSHLISFQLPEKQD